MANERSTPPAGRPISAVPYLPGLDGVRALAVMAVILFHARVSWIPGGFLGVEVFFVISGYLITLLLLAEHERTGRISVSAFYGRRARRLLPALMVLLAAVATLYSVVPYLRSSLARERAGLFWGFFYGSNWYQIHVGQSYFDSTARPPLLRHLWSLAVEEQFYIVWPLIMVVVMKVFRRRLPQIGMAFLVLALSSAVLMAVLYDSSNPNRVYLGTDTRAAGLLLGAAMAMFWRPYALARGRLGQRGRIVSIAGIVGSLILFFTNITFHDVVYTDAQVKGYDILFVGGFLLVGLATLMVIASATHMKSFYGQKILGFKPLAWLGTRSYGLYLWHWPIFQLTRPGAVDEGGDIDWPFSVLMIFRLGLTFALTEASYRLIETPIRRRTVKKWLRTFFTDRSPRMVFRRRRWGVGLAVASIFSLFVGLSVATAQDKPTDIEASLAEGAKVVQGIDQIIGTTTVDTQPTTTAALPDTTPGETLPPTTPAPTAPPTTIAKFPIIALGDSVMLGAAPSLRDNGAWVDAVVGRQLIKGIEIMQQYVAAGSLGDVVIVHLGNNGPTSEERFDELLDLLKDVPLVIILTVKVPKPWEADNNTFIFNMPAKHPNVRLIDWNGLSQTFENVFYSDGIHLRPQGQLIYTQLVMDTIKANS